MISHKIKPYLLGNIKNKSLCYVIYFDLNNLILPFDNYVI